MKLLVNGQKTRNLVDSKFCRAETIDAGDGRIESGTNTAIHDVEWLRKRHGWPGLNAVAIAESTREFGGKVEREPGYNITSLVMLTHLLGSVIPSQLAIENSLRCVMDIMIRDDERPVRTNHAPANHAPATHAPVNLPPLNTRCTIYPEGPPERTRFVLGIKSRGETVNSLRALLWEDFFTRFA